MIVRPALQRRRKAALRMILIGMLGVGLAGCTIATSTAGSSSTAASSASSTVSSAVSAVGAAPAGATVVVTVPQLAPLSSKAALPDDPVRSSSRAGPSSGRAALSSSAESPSPVTTGRSTTDSPPTTLAGSGTSNTVASSTSRASATSPPATRSSASTGSSTISPASTAAATAAPSTLSVKLVNCPTCTVLGTYAGVTSTLGAALVATGTGRAALLALRADGSVAGVGNVVYGTTFPTQAGGRLACDGASRCMVIAQQSDGTAIASAYQVSAQGGWAEVTGQPGIASVTAKAQTLTVGGGVGVAVQDEADGSTVWIVYGWEGDGYAVKGCTAAATPDPNALTMDACLS